MLGIAALTLAVGIAVGWIGQRSRFCTIAGLRDFLLARDTTLLLGLIALFAAGWAMHPIMDLVTAGNAPAVVEEQQYQSAPDDLLVVPTASGAPETTTPPGAAAEGRLPVAGLAVLIFLGGVGLGLVSTVAGGCPFRQHVLAGQGSGESRWYLVGFYAGALVFGFWSAPLLRLVLS
jgi:uncharacterized membrane protein YedE/YeeE